MAPQFKGNGVVNPRVCFCLSFVVALISSIRPALGQIGKTEITRWQYDRRAAVSLTFDDGSINQFRVAVPILNSLDLPATFHIITGEVAGSEYHGKFVGRSTQAIIEETTSVPTNKDNLFERASAIGHLGLQGSLAYHSRAGELYEDGKLTEAYQLIDEAYAKVRQGVFKPKPAGINRGIVSWDELKGLAKQGYEISSHTVTHPRLAVLDEPNLIYELEKSRQEILNHLGPKHTFTIECPYGTEDERVVKYALARYEALRNRMPEPFLEELDRGSKKDPGASTKEYVQWQRGVLTKTPTKLMHAWIDTVAAHNNMWLVLVFHGVNGIGWEPRTGEELKDYFSYIKSKEDRLWVATFQDVTKYLRERKHSDVQISRSGDVIEVVLRHGLKEEYNLPLTLKTYVPPEWSAVELRQGNQVRPVQMIREEGKAFVLYQAVPNTKTVKLVKAGA